MIQNKHEGEVSAHKFLISREGEMDTSVDKHGGPHLN